MDSAILTTLLLKSMLRFLYTFKILGISNLGFFCRLRGSGNDFEKDKTHEIVCFSDFMELKTEGHSTSRIPIAD